MEHKVWNIYNRIEFLSRTKWNRKWLFKCHCWKEFECNIDSITSWHSKSCGCWMTYNRSPKWVAKWNYVASKIMHSAKNRWIEFKLSTSEAVVLMKKPCYYCGDTWWNLAYYFNWEDREVKYNWLDRINSSKCYDKDNVVPCCKRCNWAKNDMSLEDFLSHNEKIYNFNKK